MSRDPNDPWADDPWSDDPVPVKTRKAAPKGERKRQTSPAAKRPTTTDDDTPWGLILGLTVPVILLGIFGTIFALTYDQWTFGTRPDGITAEVPEDDLQVDIVALEQDAQAASSRFAAAFVDLAGDPMIIRLAGEDGALALRDMTTPDALQDNVRIPAKLVRVTDVMVSKGERFITTLPSTQEDFAFF
ncbi:MAG: hypothetical protein AAFY03_05350, partial [Pseudomonadota bacterium]